MRPARLGAVALVLAAIAVGGCGGGSDKGDRRAAIDAYTKQENEVIGRLRPDVDRINRTYVAFSRGKVTGEQAIDELTDAEGVVRDVRRDVTDIDPPGAAKALHRRLIAYLDATVDLAVQTRRLAAYGPAASAALKPLRGVNRRLQRDLGKAKTPKRQVAVIRRFAIGLDEIIKDLKALEVPKVQLPAHRDQLARIQETRRLAGALRDALEAQDAARVARLLGRFRDQAAQSADTRRLTRSGLRAYDRLVKQLTQASADLQREQQRVFRAVEQQKA